MPDRRALVLATIHPMDRPGNVLDWMLCEGGRVISAGRGAPPAAAEEASERLDLRGTFVVPALHDCHVHLLGTGQMDLDLDLGGVRSFDEALALIADAARSAEGPILRAHSFDPDLIENGRYPSMADLDAISPALPVFVKRRDGHSSSVNSAAFEMLGAPGRDGAAAEGGRPTGVLRGAAHSAAAAAATALLTREDRAECYRRAAARAASRGIGCVHALVGRDDPSDEDVEILLDLAPRLPIDVVVFPQTMDVDRVVALGLARIGGCVLLDGSFGSRTAALSEPYCDGEGRGTLYVSDDRLTGFFRKAHGRGLQIAVHAIGERAIAQAVACYRAACGSDARDARHRIEHCELPSPGDLASLARLGIAACVQPSFDLFWGGPGGMYEDRLGERAARTNPLRTMLGTGVRLAGGSDSYVTPMDSLLGIHAAMNMARAGERLDPFDAVSLFTSRAAWFSFDEMRRGTLETGKEATFTALGDDPLRPGVSVRDIPVVALYVRGRRVFPE